MRGPVRFVVTALLLGACSGTATDTTAGAPTTGPPPDTSVTSTTPPPTTAEPAATTTTAAPGSSTTTQAPATIAPVPGTLALTRVVFGDDPYAVITNVGNTPVALDGQVLVSGGSLAELDPPGGGTIQPGRTALIVLGGEQPPQFVGMEAVVDVGTALGPVVATGGELLLATSSPVTADTVIDYVAWGTGPHLNQPAAASAGLWSRGASVELEPEAVSISSPGTIGAGVEDWSAVIGG